MKAITLTQPWATLVAVGEKREETRSWSTRYRGPLAIHAAKAFPPYARGFVTEVLEHPDFPTRYLSRHGVGMAELDAVRGCVVATCTLVDVVPTSGRPVTERQLITGDWADGRYAWLLAGVHRLDTPVPARGSLGLWEWTP